MSLGTSVIDKSSTSTVRKTAPNYKVLLHNDDFNSMEHVVETLTQTIPDLRQPQAVSIMMEAHTNGLALVITCKECWAVLDHPDCTEATMDDWFPRLARAEEALALELADLTDDLQAQVVGYELADEIDF